VISKGAFHPYEADCSPTWQDVTVRLANDSDWPQWEALFREYRISQSPGTTGTTGFCLKYIQNIEKLGDFDVRRYDALTGHIGHQCASVFFFQQIFETCAVRIPGGSPPFTDDKTATDAAAWQDLMQLLPKQRNPFC